MAKGGHQNAHNMRDAKKLKVEAHHTNLPYLTRSTLSSVNPFSSTKMRVESMANQPSILGPIVDSSSPSLSRMKEWRHKEAVHAQIGEKFYGPMVSTRPSAPFLLPIVDSSSSSLSRINEWRHKEAVHAKIREKFYGPMKSTRPSAPLAPSPPVFGVPDFFKPSAPLARPPPAKSTMFFGVPDFFKPSVAPKIPPSARASTSNAVIVDTEEDEEKDLNLDLTL